MLEHAISELQSDYYFDDRVCFHNDGGSYRVVVTGCDREGRITFTEIGRLAADGKNCLFEHYGGGTYPLGTDSTPPTAGEIEYVAMALADICSDQTPPGMDSDPFKNGF